LGRLQVELSTGKMVRLEQLRQFCRPVIIAGSAAEVQLYMETAEASRAALLERGVLAIPVVLDGGGQGGHQALEGQPLAPGRVEGVA